MPSHFAASSDLFSPDLRRKGTFAIEMSEIKPSVMRKIANYEDADQPSPFLDFNLWSNLIKYLIFTRKLTVLPRRHHYPQRCYLFLVLLRNCLWRLSSGYLQWFQFLFKTCNYLRLRLSFLPFNLQLIPEVLYDTEKLLLITNQFVFFPHLLLKDYYLLLLAACQSLILFDFPFHFVY